jgi:hypothetical protein
MNAIDHSRVWNFSTFGSYSEDTHPHPLEYHPHSSDVVAIPLLCVSGSVAIRAIYCNGSVFTVPTEFDTVAVWGRQRAGWRISVRTRQKTG